MHCLTQPMGKLIPQEQHLNRQPPTVVTLATTWWETVLACVKLQRIGLGVHLCVNVCCYFNSANYQAICKYVSLLSTAVDCSPLPNPANGQVNTTGTTFGQTSTYSCNTGYNLIGDSTRTCQATGNWSGSAPTCQSQSMFLLVLRGIKDWVCGF